MQLWAEQLKKMSEQLGVQLPSWGSLFSDQFRWVRLEAADASVFPACLVADFRVTDSVSAPTQMSITVLCPNASLELSSFLGQAISLVWQSDSTPTRYSGIVTQAQFSGSDGGFARYQLQVHSALWLLQHSRHNRVFQERTVIDIVETVLKAHQATLPTLKWQWQIEQPDALPVLDYRVQFDESDFDFVQRLLAQNGFIYHIQSEAEIGAHTVHFVDDSRHLNGVTRARFHRNAATEKYDGVSQWSDKQFLSCGGVELSSTHRDGGQHGNASAHSQSSASWHYSPHGFGQHDNAQLSNVAQFIAQRLSALQQLQHGTSAVRKLRAGLCLELLDHPRVQGRFLLTRVTHQGSSNVAGGKFTADYRNEFEAINSTQPWRDEVRVPQRAPLQRATVVAPSNETSYCDNLGRIKIQFPWQRREHHSLDNTGSELHNGNSSIWVSVAQTQAGAGHGALFLPRPGDEVLVDFVQGDIDQPLIIGSVYHPSRSPAQFRNASQLPADKALSGFVSRELGGLASSALTFDDTPGELRVELHCDHADTRLQLGHLNSAREQGKAEPHGNGFVLQTQAWGSIRAHRGVLISTENHDEQMQRQSLTSQLEAFDNVATTLEKTAQQHQKLAAEKNSSAKARQQVIASFKRWDSGSNIQPKTERTEHGLMALNAAQGIAISSAQTVLLSASSSLQTQAAGSQLMQAGARMNLQAGESISLFAEGVDDRVKQSSAPIGVHVAAARGDVHIEAHQNNLHLNARDNIKIAAVQSTIEINAKQELVLTCGGSYLKLTPSGIELGSKSPIKIKTDKLEVVKGSELKKPFPNLPVTDNNTWMELELKGYEGKAMAGVKYTLQLADGTERNGTLNASGKAREEKVPFGSSTLIYHNDDVKDIPRATLDDLLTATQTAIDAEKNKSSKNSGKTS